MTATRLFDRSVIRLSPQSDDENVAEFLQGLVTNDVTGALPVYAALLSPQGKTLFDFFVWPGEAGELLVDCEASSADDLVKRLSLYRLRRKIEIARDESIAVHWQPNGEEHGSSDPRIPALGKRWLAPAADTDKAVDADYLAHRLCLGVPEGSEEMGDVLWLETNAVELNGVSFDKGCYVGQENTARMNWRQKVNRRLVVVPLSQSNEKRRKAAFEGLSLAVDHLRLDDIDAANAPDWLRASLAKAG